MTAATAAETAAWNVASSNMRAGFFACGLVTLLRWHGFPTRKGIQGNERRWLTLDISVLNVLGINFSRASGTGCLSVDLHPYDVVRVIKVRV